MTHANLIKNTYIDSVKSVTGVQFVERPTDPPEQEEIIPPTDAQVEALANKWLLDDGELNDVIGILDNLGALRKIIRLAARDEVAAGHALINNVMMLLEMSAREELS